MNLFEKYSDYEYSILKLKMAGYILEDIYDILLGRGYSCSKMRKYEGTDNLEIESISKCNCRETCSNLDVPIISPCFDCCNDDSTMPRGDWCLGCSSRCPYKPFENILVQYQRDYNVKDPDYEWRGKAKYYFSEDQIRKQKLIEEGKLGLECKKKIKPGPRPGPKPRPVPEPFLEELYILLFDIENKKNILEDLKKLSGYYGEFKCIYNMKLILLPDCLDKDVSQVYFKEDDVLYIDDLGLKYSDSNYIDNKCDSSIPLDRYKYLKEKAKEFYGE